MRAIKQYFLLLVGIAFLLSACDKADTLPYYGKGNAITLTASKSAVTPTAADSTNNVIDFSWTSPNYATDSSTFKYVLEIDSTGRNFSKETTRITTGKLGTSLTGRQLNAILLNYGYNVGTPVNLDVRVTSSYGNNNEQYLSNIVKIAVTPYADPSKLQSSQSSVTAALPTATQIANVFSWSPAFVQYTGKVTYTLQYDSAGKNFVAPQEMATNKDSSTLSLTQDQVNTMAMNSGILPPGSGKVEYRIKATTDKGAVSYSNVVNITVNTFVPVPANLYIVGDATPGGWNNPVPVPSQQFTKLDAYSFQLILGLTAGKSYVFLPVNGDWGHKYGGATDGTAPGGGVLLKDNAVPGSNTPAPAVSGVYKIVVNFQTGKYTLTQIIVPANLYIVGDATPGGWNNPVPVPSQQFSKINDATFGIVLNLTAGKSYLFLPLNGDWGHKYGGATDGTSANGGLLLADNAVPGSNTPAPATSGLYKIIVNFSTNSYTVTPYTGPTQLFIVGDATPGGWNNPVPVPQQQFTQVAGGIFHLTLPLTAGKSYLFLPVNGDWGHKYGGATDGTSANGGILLADNDVPGSNTPAPAASGTYNIDVNFITNTYKVTP
jgi:starch-binding outer membrane protein SusE/F